MKYELANKPVGLVLVIAVALAATSGCATLRRQRLQARSAPPLTSPTQTTEPTGEPDDDASLAAVAAFLQRTAEFQLPDGDTVPSPPAAKVSSGPPARKPSESKETADAESAGPHGPDGTPAPSHNAVANTQVALEPTASSDPVPALPVVQSVSIRTEVGLDLPTGPRSKSKTTNTALTLQPDEMQMTLDRLLKRLETRAAEAKDFDSEWRLRLTQLALQRDTDAASVSSHLSEEPRHILGVLIRAATAIRDVLKNPLLTGETALERVDELRVAIADRADPAISAVELCRKVVTFGSYEPMTDADFVAGRPTQTIVYTEIRNFQSRRTDAGDYLTRLGTRLEVLSTDGRSVWQHDEPQIEDRCRRRRTDFFIAQRVTLPPTLPAGDYVLKVFVEDQLSGRADEATHPFTIRPALLTAGAG